MAVSSFLIDRSALARIGHPAVLGTWSTIVQAGRVHICPVTELEVLYSARSFADFEADSADLRAIYPWTPVPERAWERAKEVQRELAKVGNHRSAGIADLLLAATAEANRLTVLHYDHDFDTVAKITGQATAWLAPPGSL